MKYVLIIGAKNELGIELANLYARNNYNLYLAGRSIKDIQDKSSAIEKKYKVKSVLCELDVTDYNSHQKIYDTLIIKPIGVIYLAGYYPNILLSTSKWSETLRTIEINYLGCMSLLNIISNQFISDRRGFIISVTSSLAVENTLPSFLFILENIPGFNTFFKTLSLFIF